MSADRTVEKATRDLRREAELAEQAKASGAVTVQVTFEKGIAKHRKVLTERRLDAD